MRCATFHGDAFAFCFGEIRAFIAELLLWLSTRIMLFHKDVDSLKIGAKANVLTLLVYVGKGSQYYCSLAQ